MEKAAAQAASGVFAAHPFSPNVHITHLSLTFHGQELLGDTKLN